MKTSATSAFSVKRSALSVLLFSGLWLLASGLCSAATPLPNVRLTGTATLPSGATFNIEGTIDFTGATIVGLPSLTTRQVNFNALSATANQLPYFTGTNTFGAVNFSALSQTLLPLTTSADWRAALLPSSAAEGDYLWFNGSVWTKVSLGSLNGMAKLTAGSFSAGTPATDYVAPGAATSSGLTLTGGTLAGRSTAGAGAIEEITPGDGLVLNSGYLHATGLFRHRLSTSSSTTVTADNKGALLDCTGTITVALTAGATVGDGFYVAIYNSGSGSILVDPDASETILEPSGTSTTKTLAQGEGVVLLWNGSTWLVMQRMQASTALTNPMTTTGDIIYAGSGGVAQRRAAGTNGYVLTMVGGVPDWASGASGSGDFVGPSSATDTALVAFDGSTGKLGKNTPLLVATDGSVTMNGTASGYQYMVISTTAPSGVPALNFQNARGSNLTYSAAIQAIPGANYGSHMAFFTKDNGSWSASLTERMRIVAGAARVLIGTTSDDTVNALQIEGSLSLRTAGNGLKIKEGSNATMGTATLSAGTATVSTTAVTANSRIFLTSQVDGGTPGFLRVSARTAGTSFTVTSGSGSDTSNFAWLIVEPAP